MRSVCPTVAPVTLSFDFSAQCFAFSSFVVFDVLCPPTPFCRVPFVVSPFVSFSPAFDPFISDLFHFHLFFFRTSEWTIVHFVHYPSPFFWLVISAGASSRKFYRICIALSDWLICLSRIFPRLHFITFSFLCVFLKALRREFSSKNLKIFPFNRSRRFLEN